jgi:hypothetical protein
LADVLYRGFSASDSKLIVERPKVIPCGNALVDLRRVPPLGGRVSAERTLDGDGLMG